MPEKYVRMVVSIDPAMPSFHLVICPDVTSEDGPHGDRELPVQPGIPVVGEERLKLLELLSGLAAAQL